MVIEIRVPKISNSKKLKEASDLNGCVTNLKITVRLSGSNEIILYSNTNCRNGRPVSMNKAAAK